MLASTQTRIVLHATTFVVWALAASCVSYWVLQLTSNSELGNRVSTATSSEPLNSAADTASMARLLGEIAPQAAAPVNNSNRFSLKGVVSGARGQEAALIAIDDKPAKAFRVGSAVEDGLFLQSATTRKVSLSASPNGPAVMTLEMPPLAN